MDGAIILAADASRIARANVHLVPDPNVPTTETGTRHRTAERVARSIDVPVISVSEDMSVITLYRGDVKHALDSVARLLGRANQALQTLERYRDRLDTVTSALSALEVEDLVTVRDVVTVLAAGRDGAPHRRGDRGLHRRAGRRRPPGPPAARGAAGRGRGRAPAGRPRLPARPTIPDAADEAVVGSASLPTDRLLAPQTGGGGAGLDAIADLESSLQPRGYRLLARIPRLPEASSIMWWPATAACRR